jgi:hypothetical protein
MTYLGSRRIQDMGNPPGTALTDAQVDALFDLANDPTVSLIEFGASDVLFDPHETGQILAACTRTSKGSPVTSCLSETVERQTSFVTIELNGETHDVDV